MGKRGNFTVVVLLIVATVTAVWLRRREYVPPPVIEAGSPTVEEAKAPLEPVSDREPANTSQLPSSNKASDGEFQTWIAKEARELDRTHVDGASKKAQIQAVVRKMTPEQSRQLLKTVKNPKAPAAEKILSTYLLVEGGARTERELADLIAAPLQEAPNYAPHSEEETKGVREKSLRIMAIDGLFSRAQKEPSARAALARAASEAADPSVRAYAENKLRQLQ